MDLRIIKTKKAIKQAFCNLASKIGIEKVKVKDICELALLNKTTFYNHYHDIDSLIIEIKEDFLLEFLGDFRQKDMLFSDSTEFLNSLHNHIVKNRSSIELLFTDKPQHFFITLIKSLRSHYLQNFPQYDNILITFILTGIIQTVPTILFDKTLSISKESLMDRLSEIIQKTNS